jgi:TP901 family phage tail tape measure protein
MPNYNFTIQATATLSPASLKNIQSQLQAVAKNAGVKIDATPIKNTGAALKDATKQSNIFGQSLTDVGKKILSWTALTGLIFGVINAIKDGVSAVTNLNTALVELQKVTNLSEKALEGVVQQASAIGDEVARTTTDIVRATSDFAKMGYTVSQALDLAKQAEILVNVADGIDDVNIATDALIATMKGFNLDASAATSIVDKLNEVSNNFAVDVDDLTTGITKVSASLAAAGNDLDQTIAMITAATEVLQDASRASVGLRTISMRLRGVSEEGEDLADLVPKLKDELDSIGVALLDDNQNFRSTYDILTDLSSVWSHLTDLQKANLTYLIAGTRQSDILNAVLTNSDTLLASYTTSLDSVGSAAKENAVYMESIAAKTELFTKALQDMWTNAINSNSIKGIVDFGTSIIKFADSLDLVNVGLAVLFAWLIKILAVQVVSWASTVSGAFSGMFSSIKDFKAGISLIGESLSGLASAGITIGIAAVTYAVTKLIEHFKELEQTYQDLKEESDDTINIFIENRDSILEMVNSLKSAQVGSEEYYDISNKLAKLIPQIVDYVDDEGNSHLKTSEYIDKHIESLDKLSDSYRNEISYDFSDQIALLSDLEKKYEALNSKIEDYQALFGSTLVIAGKAVNGGNIALTPELEYQQDFLNFQAEQIYEQIRDSIAQQVVVGTNTDSTVSDALTEYITSAISNMDVSTADNINLVGGKALEIAQAFNEGFENIDFKTVWPQFQALLNQFDESVDFSTPQSISMLQDAVNELGKQYGITNEDIRIFTDTLIAERNVTATATEETDNLANSLSSILTDSDFKSEVEGYISIINDWRNSTEDIEAATQSLADALGITTKDVTDNFDLITAYVKGDQEAFEEAFNAQLKLYNLEPSTSGVVGAMNTIIKAANSGSAAVSSLITLLIALGKVKKTNIVTGWDTSANKPIYATVYTLSSDAYTPIKTSSGSSGGGGSGSSSASDESTYIDLFKQQVDIQEDTYDTEIAQREAAINAIETQIDAQKDLLNALEKQYDTEDKLLELERARQKLFNIQQEKIRLYSEDAGGFIWIADPQDVADQQQVIADLEKEIARDAEKRAIQDQIDLLENQKNAEQAIVDQLEAKQDLLKEFISDVDMLDDKVQDNVTSWNQLIAALQSAGIAYNDISGLLGTSAATLGVTTGTTGGTTSTEDSIVSDAISTLKKGSTGEDVKSLQRALIALGYSAGSIDGIFGSKTLAAVKAFQKAVGISVDGIVGKNTKAQFKLKGYKDGGGVYATAPAMLHGTQLHPEYVQSAPAVESMMSNLPKLIDSLANGGTGGRDITINMKTDNPMTMVRTLRQVGALESITGNRRR